MGTHLIWDQESQFESDVFDNPKPTSARALLFKCGGSPVGRPNTGEVIQLRV